jgi:MFS family permease
VFLGLLPLVPLNAALTLPALARLPAVADAGEVVGGRVPHAIRLAAGAGLLIGGLGNRTVLAVPLVVLGAVLAVPALRRLLPEGSLKAAAGLPAAVATRGMETFAFFGAEAFLPLTITRVRGQSSVVGGITLTVATLAWTAGAWIQDRKGATLGRGTLVRRGMVLVTVGVAGLLLVLLPAVPVWVAAVSWSVAGFGMGIAYGGISLIALALAPAGREGSAASSVSLADVLGVSLATGAGGAFVAAGEAFGWSARVGVGGAFLLAAVGGCFGIAATRRIPRHVSTEAASAPVSG